MYERPGPWWPRERNTNVEGNWRWLLRTSCKQKPRSDKDICSGKTYTALRP
jgi:hypothetical protein